MIAALKCGEPFGAELVAVCTALFSRCRMLGLRVRRYARLLEGSNPHTKEPWAACSLGLRLAPTIQSEREAFQRVELAYVVSNR